MSAASNLDAPVTIDGVFAQIRAVMVERDRLRDSIERAAASLGLHDAANGDPASIIAKCRHVLGAGPGETLLEACTRVAQRQPRPAPLTPERAAVLDDAAEATARMVAAIEAQAREGETPDQTVERLIRERRFLESQHDLFKRASDIDGEILDAIRAALGTPEDVDVTEHARAVAADLRRTEHDLARLIAAVRDNTSTWGDVVRACDEIADLGAPGWLELALSDATDVPVRQERAAWEAHVSEAVQEGERRINAIEKERKKLATRVAELRDERERLRDALARIAAYLGVTDAANTTAIVEGAAAAREELDEARLLGHAPGLVIAIQTAVPAIRDGLNAGGSHAPEAVQARNEARDSLHALEAAVEGAEPPAAVLSAAEAEVVRALRRWRELTITEGGAHLGEWADVLIAIDKVIEAGRPLASEGKEG